VVSARPERQLQTGALAKAANDLEVPLRGKLSDEEPRQLEHELKFQAGYT